MIVRPSEPVIRVLHITTDYLPGAGGLERFVHDLAAHTAPAIDSQILCFNRIAGDSSILPAEQSIDGIPVHRIAFVDLKYYKPTLLPMALLRQADLLHVHGLGAHLDAAVATWRWHRRPIVLSTHGGIFHTDTLGGLKRIYFGIVRRAVLPRVDRIVACGSADARLFADRGVAGLSVIDNGVNLPTTREDEALQPRQIGRLLFVGRLAANKRVDRLLEVLARLRESSPLAHLRVVGPDRSGLLPNLRARATELGVADRVQFVEGVSDSALAQEYSAADLFVSASEHEGFGISAVEAMAHGCVAALNDIPAFAALLQPGAAAESAGAPPGELVDFGNRAHAAAQLAALLGRDREGMRLSARRRAADFSWQALAPQWVQLYESVADRRS